MMERGELRSTFYEIDRKMDLLRSLLGGDNVLDARPDFAARLESSWLYHENALEGIVLSHEEIQAALDNQPVSDISLAPVFEEVRRHKVAIDLLRKQGQKRKASLNLDLVKKLHGMFYEEDDTKQAGKYRRDMPIHRLYFHEIAPPDKISVKMRQLFEWVETQEARRMHPVKLGATLHYQMMRIYPFSQHSGKVSRLLMNCVLLQNDYLPVIVHAVERQRYYESLRLPAPTSISLLIESLENALTSAAKLFGAAAPARAAV